VSAGESFDWPEVDVLAAGTVGAPGRRVFYVQVRRGGEVRTLRGEKQQVAALAEYLESLLGDLPPSPERPAVAEELPAAEAELAEPVEETWVMGNIGLSYEDDDERLVLEFHEQVPEGEEGAVARVRATRAQAKAFAEQSAILVVSGRPPCPVCGHPLDPEGHVCPRSNGQTRPAR
jgi:uncharacterized repeat protein (TIGR03847 family)